MLKECNTSDVVLKDKIPRGKTAKQGWGECLWMMRIRMLREAGQTVHGSLLLPVSTFSVGERTTIDFM